MNHLMKGEFIMMIKDILPIFKKHQIYFKESYKEIGDIYTFIFEPKGKINWKAGQHGVFTLNNKKINKPTRAFSIASIPSEGHIKISMKISENPSAFKQELLNFKPGMEISMRGPIGSFYIRNQKPVVFIAGGIGITPYRALLKNRLLDSEQNNDVKLLYMDSKEEHIYKEELEKASNNPSIKTDFLVNREHLNKEIETFIIKNNNKAEYFIVGSKFMVNNIERLLKNKGINKKNIKKDTFIGY